MNTNIKITNTNLKQLIANNFPYKIEGFLHMALDVTAGNFFCSYKIGFAKPEIFHFKLENNKFIMGFEIIDDIDARNNLINWLMGFEGDAMLLKEYLKHT